MLKNISIFILTVLLLLTVHFSNAQAVSTKIMDARIDWTPTGNQYIGQVSVYLTDSNNIVSFKVNIGSQPDDSDLYHSVQTLDGAGNLSNQGSLHNNILLTSIGAFTSHPDYYARLTIMLDNGEKNEIAIHSSN